MGLLSQLAKEDLEDLRAEGLTPTDEDVVRLNALALKISNGPETTAYNAPRFAVAGGVVFWQPTMAAFYWYDFAKNFAKNAETEDSLFAYACAKGRERGHLAALTDPDDIQRTVKEFFGKCTATKDEIERAVYYAACGISDAKPEPTEVAKKRMENLTVDEREQRNYAALEETLSYAAAATGLTFDDLMCQTPSRLSGMIYAAHVQAGLDMSKPSGKAHADYLSTLNAITKRLRAEKSAAEGSAAPASPEEGGDHD